jgi:hypothetical protein
MIWLTSFSTPTGYLLHYRTNTSQPNPISADELFTKSCRHYHQQINIQLLVNISSIASNAARH